MTPEQMLVLGTAFAADLRIFEDCIAYRPTAEHLHSYGRGLLSDLARTSMEPIALACGTAVRTLKEFLREHVWDHGGMRDRLQQHLAGQAALSADADLGNIGVIAETSVAKKGPKTPGVHRQDCGARGKLENGLVTVHRGIVRGFFKTLIDAALFVPSVWSEDRARCREAKLPDTVGDRPKGRSALE
jgi:SRSO17 transposase